VGIDLSLSLPVFVVVPVAAPSALEEHLQSVRSWNFDIFRLNEVRTIKRNDCVYLGRSHRLVLRSCRSTSRTQLSQGYPLKRLFMSLVADHDLIELLRLDVKMLSNLMTKIEDCYVPNVPCTYCFVHTPDGHATAPEMHGRIKFRVGPLPHSS